MTTKLVRSVNEMRGLSRKRSRKRQALEAAQIKKEIAIIEEAKAREAAEIRRALARSQEERDREIALVALGGARDVVGLNRLVEGRLDDEAIRVRALERIRSFAV